MNPGEAQGSDPFFLNVPFNKRCDFHKATIERLYIDEAYELPSLVKKMNDNYKFRCSYKHRFRKWGFTKSVSSSTKDDAIKAIGKRVREGMSVSSVKYNDREVDKKRIRRHIDTQARQEKQLQFSNNVFMYWNLPYRALKTSSAHTDDVNSPFGANAPTPIGIAVSPAYVPAGPSSGTALSPIDAPTPTTVKALGRLYNERARYLIQGMHDDFLKDMKSYERKIAITWLHQFWFFSFKTTKHWGKGPQHWSPSLLGFSEFKDPGTNPNTPGANVGTPCDRTMSNSNIHKDQQSGEDFSNPSMLCRWSIHYFNDDYYDSIPSPPEEPQENFDMNSPDSWPLLSGSFHPTDLMNRLQEALQDNSFSNIEIKHLPLSASQIVKAAQRSPEELLREAFGFAIMARNEELLWAFLSGSNATNFDVSRLFPFHLATSYLDGAKTCCNVVDALVSNLVGPNLIVKVYVNDHGHTVLDNLMIAILKAHTSCPPVNVDDCWRKLKRFAGEEVDVCGRWDADSPCIRSLLADGRPTIPFEWKHMFCHTSAQAICHSIATIFTPFHAPDINTLSGLFRKVCSHCQQILQLQPLHCLVLTAFHLARSGCQGETLFGIVACLVCLLVHGVDPLRKAHISIKALLDTDRADECSHEFLDPIELAHRVPPALMSMWNEDVKLGWQVFSRVLLLALQERRRPPRMRSSTEQREYDEEFRAFIDHKDDSDEDYDMNEMEDCAAEPFCEHTEDTNNFYGGSKEIGTLWAAVQTEILTYRRVAKKDAWISENFKMSKLLNGLNSGYGVCLIPLVEDKMMQPFCHCGRFSEAMDWACVTAQEACTEYFSNLEDWKRSTFITMPPSRS